MTIKKITTSILSLLFITGLYAQNEVDALRYSEVNLLGSTARSSAMGGAFGALGGDFSTLSTNPAGLGTYLSSEFSLTPALYTSTSEATFYGNTTEDTKYNVNVGNLGFVFSFMNKTENNWKGINFGVGVNRTNNYHSQIIFDGINNESSLLDYYVDFANKNGGVDGDRFGAKLAYQTYLLDQNSNGSWYNWAPIDENGGILPVEQRELSKRKGSSQDFVFSAATNYKDKLFIGATIAVPTFDYDENIIYTEFNPNGMVDTSAFDQFTLIDNLEASGKGVNVKIGVLFKPLDWLRIGGAVHSPTFYTIEEYYSSENKSWFLNGDNYNLKYNGNTEYNLTTPLHLLANVAFILKGLGAITAEYEMVDYSTMKLDSDYDDFFYENRNIQENFTQAHNFKIGAEYKIESFALRAGYAFYGSPYELENFGEKTYYTFGLGLREKDFYADLAYIMKNKHREEYKIYNYDKLETTKIDHSAGNIMLTLGFRF